MNFEKAKAPPPDEKKKKKVRARESENWVDPVGEMAFLKQMQKDSKHLFVPKNFTSSQIAQCKRPLRDSNLPFLRLDDASNLKGTLAGEADLASGSYMSTRQLSANCGIPVHFKSSSLSLRHSWVGC